MPSIIRHYIYKHSTEDSLLQETTKHLYMLGSSFTTSSGKTINANGVAFQSGVGGGRVRM